MIDESIRNEIIEFTLKQYARCPIYQNYQTLCMQAQNLKKQLNIQVFNVNLCNKYLTMSSESDVMTFCAIFFFCLFFGLNCIKK